MAGRLRQRVSRVSVRHARPRCTAAIAQRFRCSLFLSVVPTIRVVLEGRARTPPRPCAWSHTAQSYTVRHSNPRTPALPRLSAGAFTSQPIYVLFGRCCAPQSASRFPSTLGSSLRRGPRVCGIPCAGACIRGTTFTCVLRLPKEASWKDCEAGA
jgi:hypothetical protein